ncbi:MAG: pilin [Patescibacteria group bacterium]|jgi:hypothetical protein
MIKKIVTFFAIIAVFALPQIALAQFTISPNLPTTLGISTTTKTVEDTMISIVNWVLGLLGLIAVIMIMASAVIAATSGDSNKAETAKKALFGAIIGLVVVLLAWAIVHFVVQATNTVTN